MIQRNLDGIYYRIKRDDKFENICFSDLTEQEQEDILDRIIQSRTQEQAISYLRELAKLLSQSLREIGDQLDMFGGE